MIKDIAQKEVNRKEQESNGISSHSRVTSILVSQPKPSDENSHYFELAKNYNLTIDFRPFIKIEPVSSFTFRKQKINILSHTAIIFTSRNAVDHFFRICSEIRVEMPASMKYFCISEQTANYLQKYIVIKKRKFFIGERTAQELIEKIKKRKGEKFLFPCSNIRKNDIPDFLKNNGYDYSEAVIYKTIASDLSDLANVNYDIIAFFSPSGINSLFANFPDFKQKQTRIAAFGPATTGAALEAGLTVNIEATQSNTPSMTAALEKYIKKVNGVK